MNKSEYSTSETKSVTPIISYSNSKELRYKIMVLFMFYIYSKLYSIFSLSQNNYPYRDHVSFSFCNLPIFLVAITFSNHEYLWMLMLLKMYPLL